VKIHLKQISPEGLHLEGEEDCPIPELEADGVRCVGPMRYQLEVGISDGALWANGSLAQPVEVSCVACLEKFTYEIKVPSFAVHTELRGPEVIDLMPFVREDILLNLSAYPHCDREGGLVCKAAKPTKSSAEERLEQEAKREHDWEALDKLKLRK
jgi:uncharacterized metal-binding protein YceD (DUF177 family)